MYLIQKNADKTCFKSCSLQILFVLQVAIKYKLRNSVIFFLFKF